MRPVSCDSRPITRALLQGHFHSRQQQGKRHPVRSVPLSDGVGAKSPAAIAASNGRDLVKTLKARAEKIIIFVNLTQNVGPWRQTVSLELFAIPYQRSIQEFRDCRQLKFLHPQPSSWARYVKGRRTLFCWLGALQNGDL